MPELVSDSISLKKINHFFLYVMIPIFGFTIPNITGLIENSTYGWWQLCLSYSWFIFTSYAIWQGNLFLLKKTRTQHENNGQPYYRIIILYLISNILFIGIFSILMICGWYYFLSNNVFNQVVILKTTTSIIFCVLLVNSIYEIIFLRKEMEDSFLKVRLLEMDKIKAELAALKSQIDPHFMFNSLNTLSYLITTKPGIAKIYNDTLAKVYRYILVYKDENLVFLKEELEFISNYFYLINIRYGNAVNLLIEIPDVKAENYLLTPVSLQILIENAIKHNDFSVNEPLIIQIAVQSGFVKVSNRIRKKEYAEISSGIGLHNLKERSFLITKRNIIVTNELEEFTVKVPILKS